MAPVPKRRDSSSYSTGTSEDTMSSKDSEKSTQTIPFDPRTRTKKISKSIKTSGKGKRITSQGTTIGKSSRSFLRRVFKGRSEKIVKDQSDKSKKTSSSKPATKKSAKAKTSGRTGNLGKKRSSGKKSKRSYKPIVDSEDSEKSSHPRLEESDSTKSGSRKVTELLVSGETMKTAGFETSKRSVQPGRADASAGQPTSPQLGVPRKISDRSVPIIPDKKGSKSRTPSPTTTEASKKTSKSIVAVKKESIAKISPPSTTADVPKKVSKSIMAFLIGKKESGERKLSLTKTEVPKKVSKPILPVKKESSTRIPPVIPTEVPKKVSKPILPVEKGSSTKIPPVIPTEVPKKVSKPILPVRKESSTKIPSVIPTEVPKQVSKPKVSDKKESGPSTPPSTPIEAPRKISKTMVPVKKESRTSQTPTIDIPKKTSETKTLPPEKTQSLRFTPESPEKSPSKRMVQQALIPKKAESSPLRFAAKKRPVRGRGKSAGKGRAKKSADTSAALESGAETDETRDIKVRSKRRSNLRSKKKLKPLDIELPPGVKIDPKDAIKAITNNREKAIEVVYSDDFPKNRTRFPFSRGNTQLSTIREQDSSRHQKNGLLKTNKEIFGKNFFDVIRILNRGEKTELIFIKSDKHSRNILDKSVGWLSSKRFGVIRIFDLSETLSNNLSQKALFVYLINLHRISDQQFKMFTTDLKERSYAQCYVFLTHPIDPCGQFVAKRVSTIENIASEKGLHPPLIVGAFAAYNPYIGLLNGESAHLKYIQYFSSKSRRSAVYNYQRFLSVTIAFRLVNFFEQMNQFPHIYYYDAPWHSLNRDIAALLYSGLTSMVRKRKANTNTTGYRKEFTLIVIDRSYDMITPILHSEDIQSFIGQELKRYDLSIESDFLSPTFRNFPIDRASTKLLEIVKLVRGREHRMTLKQRSRCSKLVNDCNYLCERVIHRFKCGYGRILAYERHVLGNMAENIDRFRRIDEEDKLHFLPCDLMRLVMIMCTTKNKTKKEALRLIGPNNLTSAHHKLIKDYKNLIRKLRKLAPISNITYPMLQKVIYKYFNGVLPEKEFPSVGSQRVGPTSRPKLIIFMLGGLSYNEIQLGGTRGARDQPVTLLSTDLLSAQSFLTQLFPTTEMAERALFSQRGARK